MFRSGLHWPKEKKEKDCYLNGKYCFAWGEDYERTSKRENGQSKGEVEQVI